MLLVKNLSVQIDGRNILNNINLELNQGEIIALTGPSGCGKSTFLNTLLGFQTPSSGEIELDGKSILEIPTEERNIGLVFQDNVLFPNLTVEENISYGLSHLSLEESNARVKEMLEMVKLENHIGKLPHQLSGGEKQRIALARALARKPQVILLDESFSNLDAQLRVELRSEIRRILKSLNQSCILVTHDRNEAQSFAERIIEIA